MQFQSIEITGSGTRNKFGDTPPFFVQSEKCLKSYGDINNRNQYRIYVNIYGMNICHFSHAPFNDDESVLPQQKEV